MRLGLGLSIVAASFGDGSVSGSLSADGEGAVAMTALLGNTGTLAANGEGAITGAGQLGITGSLTAAGEGAISVSGSIESSDFAAGLDLNGYWTDYAGTAPWAGTASVGPSGDGSHDLTAGSAPGAGSDLNGLGVADFNGSSHTLSAEGSDADYITTTSIYGAILMNPDSTGGGYVLAPDDAGFEISFEHTPGSVNFGVRGQESNVLKAMSTGSWQLVTFRLAGGVQEVGVNEEPGASGGGSTASGVSALSSRGWTLRVGQRSGLFYDGKIAMIILTDVAIDYAALIDWVNETWGLSL